MTKRHTEAIWSLNLPPVAKLVYLALYWRQGPTGCHPSHEELARMTGLSERAIRNAITLLKKRGLLTVNRTRKGTNPLHQLNHYRLTPTATADAVDALTRLVQQRHEMPLLTPARRAGTPAKSGTEHRHDVPGIEQIIEKDKRGPVDNRPERPENPEHRASLTLSEYLETARLAGTSGKKSGQATKNGAGPLTIALGESRREPATGVAGIGENAKQSRIQRI